jgi:hypothetical protein
MTQGFGYGVHEEPRGAVCHHCGKPLLAESQKLIEDDAFGASDSPIGRYAVHCQECKNRFHPGAQERPQAGYPRTPAVRT